MEEKQVEYNDSELKFLEFIQNIITRMNSNSFSIKQMTIMILSAILAIYASVKNTNILFITFLPIIVFWFLDSYYLQQERIFRKLYDRAIERETKLFDMSAIKNISECYCGVLFSKTILLFYLGTFILNIFIIIIIIGA
ncbi:MAG: hypothetical protein HDT11_01935 [Helicobacter sp.]|nr:hypothetical protein [Helicobacter sp.]